MSTRKMYVANTTKQVNRFVVQTRKMGGNHGQRIIPPGHQTTLEMEQQELDDIIKYHTRYGMREFGDGSRLKGFTGLVYRFDEPVNMDAMLETYEANDKSLEKDATDRRVATAAAISEGIAETLHKETGIDAERVRPRQVELETVEETDGKPAVAAGVQISAPGVAPTRQGKQLDRKSA